MNTFENPEQYHPEQEPSAESAPHPHSVFDYIHTFETAKGKENPYTLESINQRAFTAEFVREGDCIVVEAQDIPGQEKGYIFKVESAQWSNLGLSGVGPTKSLIGKMEGLFVPDDIKDTSVYFVGSGEGGSAVIPGVFFVGRSVYVKDINKNEYHMPMSTSIGVVSENPEGELFARNIYESSDMAPELKEKQRRYSEEVASLMEHFFLDNIIDVEAFVEGNDPKKESLDFDDADYTIKFRYQPHTGGELIIVNKAKQKMVFCKVFSPGGEHIMQVSEVDIKENPSLLSHMADIENLDSSAVHRANASCVTHTISARLGLDTCSYQPNEYDITHAIGLSAERFGLDKEDERQHVSIPSIAVLCNHKKKSTHKHIDTDVTFNRAITQDATLEQDFSDKVDVFWNPEGRHAYRLGRTLHTVRNVHDILSEL